MIWESMPLMGFMDVAIVLSAVAVMAAFYRHRDAIHKLGVGNGVVCHRDR